MSDPLQVTHLLHGGINPAVQWTDGRPESNPSGEPVNMPAPSDPMATAGPIAGSSIRNFDPYAAQGVPVAAASGFAVDYRYILLAAAIYFLVFKRRG